MFDRRQFLRTSSTAAVASWISAWAARSPVKIAHREGNMPKKLGASVYELAASVPGLYGLEVGSVRLWDHANALAYKKESDRWNIRTVSMSSVFPQGASLATAGPAAEDAIRKAIQSGEILGATVVAIGGFFDTCPNMDNEASYGPSVELLKKMGPVAADSGMNLGLELSLSLAEYQKLIGLVAHPSVRPYWDATGTDHTWAIPVMELRVLKSWVQAFAKCTSRTEERASCSKRGTCWKSTQEVPCPRGLCRSTGRRPSPSSRTVDLKGGLHLKLPIPVSSDLSQKARKMSSS
jgi:hypothetical protein